MAVRSGFLDRRPVLVGLVFLGGCLGTLIRAEIACSKFSSMPALTRGFAERFGSALAPVCLAGSRPIPPSQWSPGSVSCLGTGCWALPTSWRVSRQVPSWPGP